MIDDNTRTDVPADDDASLDALIRQATDAIRPSDDLAIRIREHIARDERNESLRHRFHRRVGVVLAAAAACGVCISGAVLMLSQFSRTDETSRIAGDVPAEPEANQRPAAANRVRLSFDPNADAITVPVATREPDVTILMVYPIDRPAPASEPDDTESRAPFGETPPSKEA